MKLYKYGLVVGRFQLVHEGHKMLIDTALELCEKVVVFIGSAQEHGTLENPFSYTVREEMLEKVFESAIASKRLFIRPLCDIGAGNNDIWGRYVLGKFEVEFHQQPNLYVTGLEKNRSSWFNNEIAPNMDELRISRNSFSISAYQCRIYIKYGQKELWQRHVPTELHGEYEFFRSVLTKIKDLPQKWVYRLEHTDPKKGAWYNKNGEFCCEHPILKKLAMPFEPDVYRGVYKSACENGKDLAYWIPKEAAQEMLSEGYVFTRYLTNDYFYRDHGEICFNKTTYLQKEAVSLEEVYK